MNRRDYRIYPKYWDRQAWPNSVECYVKKITKNYKKYAIVS